MNLRQLISTTAVLSIYTAQSSAQSVTYPIVDTEQIYCYDNKDSMKYPQQGSDYFGQDAIYRGNNPSYTDNGDGTISDNVTGLMWQKSPGGKQTWNQAVSGARRCTTGGYKDWRVPTIKELYSLILFSGTDPDPGGTNTTNLKPFLNTDYFSFQYGNARAGERIIDCQYGSRTKYVSTTMKGDATMFGVNFADGRIKGYALESPRTRQDNKFYFIYVRGNSDYGKNKFKDNKDGTITDHATGLTWMKVDSGALNAGYYKDGRMNWRQALEWSEALEYAGYSDWRLPNAKELQSIVDYSRSPKKSSSAAINPIFKVSKMKDEGGKRNYPFYWTGSTHVSTRGGEAACYVAFGEALGWMKDRRRGKYTLMDVHGAGAQRSDPKSGDPSKFPQGRGPQGDVIRIGNYVLCVRGGKADIKSNGPVAKQSYRSGRRQERSQGGASDNFTRRLDKDGDGKVSKNEFDGPKKHFSHLDKNNDGYISGDEIPSGPPPRR